MNVESNDNVRREREQRLRETSRDDECERHPTRRRLRQRIEPRRLPQLRERLVRTSEFEQQKGQRAVSWFARRLDGERLSIVCQSIRQLHSTLESGGLALLQGVQLVEPAEEKEIGDLLDHFERVRDPAGPEGVPDLINLVAYFASQHRYRV